MHRPTQFISAGCQDICTKVMCEILDKMHTVMMTCMQ